MPYQFKDSFLPAVNQLTNYFAQQNKEDEAKVKTKIMNEMADAAGRSIAEAKSGQDVADAQVEMAQRLQSNPLARQFGVNIHELNQQLAPNIAVAGQKINDIRQDKSEWAKQQEEVARLQKLGLLAPDAAYTDQSAPNAYEENQKLIGMAKGSMYQVGYTFNEEQRGGHHTYDRMRKDAMGNIMKDKDGNPIKDTLYIKGTDINGDMEIYKYGDPTKYTQRDFKDWDFEVATKGFTTIKDKARASQESFSPVNWIDQKTGEQVGGFVGNRGTSRLMDGSVINPGKMGLSWDKGNADPNAPSAARRNEGYAKLQNEAQRDAFLGAKELGGALKTKLQTMAKDPEEAIKIQNDPLLSQFFLNKGNLMADLTWDDKVDPSAYVSAVLQRGGDVDPKDPVEKDGKTPKKTLDLYNDPVLHKYMIPVQEAEARVARAGFGQKAGLKWDDTKKLYDDAADMYFKWITLPANRPSNYKSMGNLKNAWHNLSEGGKKIWLEDLLKSKLKFEGDAGELQRSKDYVKRLNTTP